MEIPKISIPQDDIYKVFVLNANGNTERICVFSRGNNTGIFSEIQLAEYAAQGIDIVYSENQLHRDDSIRIIKKKVINEIGENEICYEEIYFFVNVLESINVMSVYQQIIKNDTKNDKKNNPLFTQEKVRQLLLNMNIGATEIEEKLTMLDIKEHYLYEDLLKIVRTDEIYPVSIPFGQQFSEERDYLFSANPFRLFSNSVGNIDYTNNNSLLSFENHLLLNYGNIENNTIYLCRTEKVFEYLNQLGIDMEYVSQTYFPLLYKKSITSFDEFLGSKQALIKENEKLLNKQTKMLYKSVTMFYDIYNSRGENELMYLNRGIKEFEIKIKSELKSSLPLEVIFKNIHSTMKMPFIKFIF